MLRKIIYKLGYFVFLRKKYRDFMDYYEKAKAYQHMSRSDVEAAQDEALYHLLTHTIENVPFYQEFSRKNDISLSKDKIRDDLARFPIITKDILNESWERFHSVNKSSSAVEVRSGGTTGQAAVILQDWDYRIELEASRLVGDGMAGYELGDRMALLWGNVADFIKERGKLFDRLIQRHVKNTIMLNAFKMSEDAMKKYWKRLTRFKPKILLAFAESLYEFSRFMAAKGLKAPRIGAIISSGGVLTDEMKEFIQEVMDCHVYNRYGSREVGIVSMSCEASDMMHLMTNRVFLEIVDDDGNRLPPGEKGHILVTSLVNKAMPLIRYKIGDMASLNLDNCPCGRGTPRLEKVFGRSTDIFRTRDGRIIDGQVFMPIFYRRHLVDDFRIVKQFQFVQQDYDVVEINLVTGGKKLAAKTEQMVSDTIKKIMGKDCQVHFNYLDRLEPSPSGKHRYVISKVK